MIIHRLSRRRHNRNPNKWYNLLMLVMSWLGWWYGSGWRNVLGGLRERLRRIYLSFSVPLLLATLMAPWRRIISAPGGSLGQQLRAMVDNTVSRFVGFIVRILALIAAGLMMGFISIGGLILVVIWPFIPVAGVIFILIGVIK